MASFRWFQPLGHHRHGQRTLVARKGANGQSGVQFPILTGERQPEGRGTKAEMADHADDRIAGTETGQQLHADDAENGVGDGRQCRVVADVSRRPAEGRVE